MKNTLHVSGCLLDGSSVALASPKSSNSHFIRRFAQKSVQMGALLSTSIALTACSLGGSLNSSFSATPTITTPSSSKVALALSNSSLTLTEGGTALIGFALQKPLTTDTTINVSLQKIGGSSVTRFAAFSPTITIPAGQQVGSVTLVTINDAISEGPENFELVLSSAQLDTSAASLHFTLTDDEPIPTVTFASASQSINKSTAGVASLTATLSGVSANPISIPLTISGTAAVGTDATVSSTTLTIPAQASSASVTVTAINNSVIEADKTVVVDMGAATGVTLGATQRHTVTIVNDLINPFSISGVSSSTITTPGTVLVGTVSPTINWGSATNATSYDVTIYDSGGTTAVCATQNTTLLSYAPTSCNLTVGQSYKASVIAKAGTGTRAATNTNFVFRVNTNPSPASHGPIYVMKGGGLSISVSSLLATDTDADTGETATLTVTSATGSANSTAILTGGVISYSPAASYTGADTITYQLADTNGGTATGSIHISVVTPTTWTGDAGTTDFSNSGNWCGAINSSQSGCTGGGVVPSTGDVAIFDGTCTANCSAALTSNISIGGLALNLGYGGTLSQMSTFTMAIGSSGWTQKSGTFAGSDSGISLGGAFSLSGGTFTAPSNTIAAGNSWTVSTPAVFHSNSGTLSFNGDATIAPGTVSYNNVSFGGWQPNFNLSGTMKIAGTLSGSASGSYGGVNGGTIEASGPISMSNSGMSNQPGSTLVRVVGTTSQTITGTAGAYIPNLEIASTGGTVTFSGTVDVGNNYTFTSGTLGVASSTLALHSGTHTFTTESYNNVSFTGWQINNTINGTLKVGGTLIGQSSGSYGHLNGGTIAVYGDASVSDRGLCDSDGTTLIKVVGSGSHTLTGVANANFPILEIATSGTVNFSGTVDVIGNYTFTSGTLVAGTSTLALHNGSHTFSSETYNNVSFSGWQISNTLNGTLKIAGTLYGDSTGSYGGMNGGTIALSGDASMSDAGLSNQGGSTAIRVIGTGNHTLSGTALAYYTNLEIASTGGTVTLSGVVDIAGNYTYTSGVLAVSGSTLSLHGGTHTFGSESYDNVTIGGFQPNLTFSGTLRVGGTLTANSSGSYGSINGGTIAASGNIVMTDAGFENQGGTTVVRMVGSNQTITGTAGTMIPNLTIAESSGTVSIVGPIGVRGATSVTSGALALNDASSSLATYSLALNGSTLAKNGGSVSVNGTDAGTGSVYGGTINP